MRCVVPVKLGKFKREKILLDVEILHRARFDSGRVGDQNPVEFLDEMGSARSGTEFREIASGAFLPARDVAHFPDYRVQVIGCGEGFPDFLFELFRRVVVIFRRVDETRSGRVAPEALAEPLCRGAEEFHARESGCDFLRFGDEFFQSLRIRRRIDFDVSACFRVNAVRRCDIDGDCASRCIDRVPDGVVDFRNDDPVERPF